MLVAFYYQRLKALLRKTKPSPKTSMQFILYFFMQPEIGSEEERCIGLSANAQFVLVVMTCVFANLCYAKLADMILLSGSA